MSNADDQPPPPWAQELLQRLQALEQQQLNPSMDTDTSPSSPPAESTPLNSDPNVSIRLPSSDFTPPADFLQRFPFINLDFFRRPLQDIQRRRFLSEHPSNTIRQYSPPEPMRVQTSHQHRHMEQQLYDIQYRLSGLTRPLDWHLYRIYNDKISSYEEIQKASIEFATGMHELLSDLASHITELRTKNLYKASNLQGQPPSLSQQQNTLVEAKSFTEHINLERSLQQALSKHRPRSKKPSHQHHQQNRQSTSSSSSSTAPHQQQQHSDQKYQPKHHPKKDFHVQQAPPKQQ
jgi:hypothetical protein